MIPLLLFSLFINYNISKTAQRSEDFGNRILIEMRRSQWEH